MGKSATPVADIRQTFVFEPDPTNLPILMTNFTPLTQWFRRVNPYSDPHEGATFLIAPLSDSLMKVSTDPSNLYCRFWIHIPNR